MQSQCCKCHEGRGALAPSWLPSKSTLQSRGPDPHLGSIHIACVCLSHQPNPFIKAISLPCPMLLNQGNAAIGFTGLCIQNKGLLASTSDKHQHPNISFQCEFLKKHFSAQQEMILSMPSACRQCFPTSTKPTLPTCIFCHQWPSELR